MKAVSLLSACWVLCSYPVLAQQRYTLDEVIGLVRGQSPLALQAETRKENRYWQYRLYQSNYRPQLWLNGDLPDYNRDFFSTGWTMVPSAFRNASRPPVR